MHVRWESHGSRERSIPIRVIRGSLFGKNLRSSAAEMLFLSQQYSVGVLLNRHSCGMKLEEQRRLTKERSIPSVISAARLSVARLFRG